MAMDGKQWTPNMEMARREDTGAAAKSGHGYVEPDAQTMVTQQGHN
jgi:hypothetical protein